MIRKDVLKRFETIVLISAPVGFLVGALLAGMMLSGCGKQKAKVQTQEQFTPPNYSGDGQGFYLQADDAQRNFAGTALVWQPTVSAEDVTRIINANKKTTSIDPDKLRYMRDSIAPAALELQEVVERKIRAEEQVRQNTVDVSLKAADAMFEEFLAQVAGVRDLGQMETIRARSVMTLYCEAKLWERTVNSQLIAATYTRRPNPAAVCSTIYEQLGLISEKTAECAPAAEGKNYFACLWKQGVLKTRLFQAVYSNQSTVGQKVAAFDVELLKGKYNFGAVGNSQSRAFLQLRKVRLKNDAGEAAGEIDAVTSRQTEDLLLGSLSVSDILVQFEDGRLALLEKPTPVVGEDGAVVIVEDPAQPFVANFRDATAKLLRLSDGAWVNEVLINAPFAKELKPEFRRLKPDIEEEMKRLLPRVCDVAADAKLVRSASDSAEQLRRLVTRGADLLREINGSANCETESEKISCKAASAGREQIKVAREAQISQALFSTQVSLPKSKDRTSVRVDLVLDRSAKSKVSACFDLNSRKQVSCEEGAPLVQHFQVDDISGRILFVAKVDDVAAFGSTKKLRVDDDLFNEIPAEMQGRFVRVELFPNNYEKLLDFMSGSISFTTDAEGSDVLATGAISLRDEAPLYKTITDRFEAQIQKQQM